MIKALLPEPECERLAPTLKKQHGKRYRDECLPKVKAFPGVRALFESLASAGCARTLVTSCAKDGLDNLMRIADLVACIACGEEVEPHPDLIDLALTKNGYAPRRAIMVGDTPFDATAAEAAGVPAIGLLSGGFSSGALLAAGCKGTYRDPEQLQKELPSWLDASDA
jgi:phosphoglycolate phosphatase-like HAD superfamily hydrolase